MGELTASLAHEIKQPITASVINAETCLEWLTHEKPDREEIGRAAANVVEAGRRAGGIIDRLRALYTKAPPQRELVDVNEVIREMILLLRGEANRSAVSTRADLAIEAMKDTGGICCGSPERLRRPRPAAAGLDEPDAQSFPGG